MRMNEKKHEPLMKAVKRIELKKWQKMLFGGGSVLVALVIASIFIAVSGFNPLKFFGYVIKGSVSSPLYITLLIRTFVPLLVTSLGVAVAFKMRFWNIGGEGQFLIGAALSMTMALVIGNGLPHIVGVIIVLISGTIGGALYGGITAICKVKFNTNETLFTLMLNYIALYLVTYFLKIKFFIKPDNGIPVFKVIDKSLWLSEIKIGGLSFDTALFIGLILFIFIFVYFKYCKQGYEVSVVGDSKPTAKYAGMKVKWIVIRTMLISGGLIGLAGAMQMAGSAGGHTLATGITGGVGWTGIIVAWLAKLNPVGIVVISLLMSILQRGSSVARSSMGIAASMSDVIQGIILFSVLACDFFINYKIVFRKKVSKEIAKSDNKSLLEPEKEERLSILSENATSADESEWNQSTENNQSGDESERNELTNNNTIADEEGGKI